LWKEGVFHRDVSPGNLLWYRSLGKLIGVLNDFDLSSLADDQGPRGNERTGTIPFMALELLSAQGQRGEVKHRYRHDLESFMWCFAWISLRYENGALLPVKSRRLDDWATSDAVTCGMLKLYFLNNLKEYRSPHIESLMWKILVECFVVLKKKVDARYHVGLQWLSDGDEQPDSEESESDIDGFLQAFKCTTS
jgi:serine/threonine protein kinase